MDTSWKAEDKMGKDATGSTQELVWTSKGLWDGSEMGSGALEVECELNVGRG